MFLLQYLTQTNKTNNKNAGRLDPVIQHASHLPKPQLKFTRRPDNSSAMWRPALRHKYNAQVPLGYDLRDEDEDTDMNASYVSLRLVAYPSHNMFAQSTSIPT